MSENVKVLYKKILAFPTLSPVHFLCFTHSVLLYFHSVKEESFTKFWIFPFLFYIIPEKCVKTTCLNLQIQPPSVVSMGDFNFTPFLFYIFPEKCDKQHVDL